MPIMFGRIFLGRAMSLLLFLNPGVHFFDRVNDDCFIAKSFELGGSNDSYFIE